MNHPVPPKPRIILFGAGKGGERFLRRCGERYQVLAFCDNDPAKQGHPLSGLPIISPTELGHLEYDAIIVASMFGHEIKTGLIAQYHIPEERITFAPKSALSPNKTYRPFEDPATLTMARTMLAHLDTLLRQAGIPYFVDHGTLLGLLRDGDLLPWDDDLDLSVPEAFIEQTLQTICDNQTTLPLADELEWTAETVIDQDTGRIMGAIICYRETNHLALRKFAASIWFMFAEGDTIRQFINRAPAAFFHEAASLTYRDRAYPVPRDAENYLAFHYGNWREPVKDMSLEEILNYCPPPPRVRREYLFGTPDTC